MKMRTLKLTPKFLLGALQGKGASIITNLPRDAQLLDIKFDLCNNQVLAVIRSDSFEDIAELYPIPELKLAHSTAPTPSASVAKSEAKPAAITKPTPEPTKKTQGQTSEPANRVEQEFTPEQRRLLSFKSEDDRVIVKPTQFLKGEWEDINEVVKSLSGKWVKGDIISYWEIPSQ
jgi:hypothetical protein